jgi:hypothetical protein
MLLCSSRTSSFLSDDGVHAVEDVVVVERDGEALALDLHGQKLGGLALVGRGRREAHDLAVCIDVKAHGGVGDGHHRDALERRGKASTSMCTEVLQLDGRSWR